MNLKKFIFHTLTETYIFWWKILIFQSQKRLYNHQCLFVCSSACLSVHLSVTKTPNSFKSIISPYHYLHHHQFISQSSNFQLLLHLFIERLLRLFGLFLFNWRFPKIQGVAVADEAPWCYYLSTMYWIVIIRLKFHQVLTKLRDNSIFLNIKI